MSGIALVSRVVSRAAMAMYRDIERHAVEVPLDPTDPSDPAGPTDEGSDRRHG